MLKIVGVVLVTVIVAVNAQGSGVLGLVDDLLGGDNVANPCDCMQIEFAQAPSDLATCSSLDFQNKLNNSLTANYDTVYKKLQERNDCDFKDYETALEGVRGQTLKLIGIFSDRGANIATFYKAIDSYEAVVTVHNKQALITTASQQSIDCADNLVQARPIPLAFSESVSVALLKCILMKK